MSWIPVAVTFFLALKTVQSQVWAGNFTGDSSCVSGSCCCIGPNIQLTRLSDGFITFTTGLYGQCFGLTTYSGQSAYPTGYSTSISVSIITLTFTLSSDSNRITIANSMGASCGVLATRTVLLQTTTAAAGSTTNAMPTTQSNDAPNIRFDWLFSLSMVTLLIIMAKKTS